MTILERKKFEQRKIRLSRAIINDMDENRVLQIEKLYDVTPLSYSVNELRESIDEFEERYISGNFKGISHDEVMKEYGL
ncbi:MAG: hypothetical protein LBL24_02125 [Bacteroidales bacterium]|jgi:hypothetical protein|nr:hypothetical protein [Bacteroidales bacterium]